MLCVVYNLFAKRVLNLAPDLAWTTAWFQMTGGLSYVLPLWWMNARPTPSLSGKDQRRLLPVAFLHSLVHIGGVVSMGAGAVSFTYIVKASEPAVSAALAALTGSFLYWTVYLALFPVIAGVAMVRTQHVWWGVSPSICLQSLMVPRHCLCLSSIHSPPLPSRSRRLIMTRN